MSAFVSYQSSFNTALSKFLADPQGESDPAKVAQRWNVLEKFEILVTNASKATFSEPALLVDQHNVACIQAQNTHYVTASRCSLAKVAQRWNVLEKFEINFNHHTKLHLDAVT
jgi:hypothetical protein